MAANQTEPETAPPHRLLKPGPETLAALAGTLLAALLLLLTAIHAGPLWRDEVNTANVAAMPSIRESWKIESFPPLWPLLLRGSEWLGLADGDAGIRVLGLYVGLFFLATLWITARWLGCRGPSLSVALLGCLPACIFILGSNRAYGLACGLLVLSFGTLWRVLEKPSAARVLGAALACLLFTQCVYYDAVFLVAMMAGSGLAAVRRRRWKTLAALFGIGAVSAASLTIYRFLLERDTPVARLIEFPYFSFATLWDHFRDAVTARSSGELGHNGPEIWLWIALVAGGLAAALAAQRVRATGPAAAAASAERRADLALYCGTSLILGIVGLFAFMYRLHYVTQSWYYIELLCLCAISLDGLLGANWPAPRPWGMVRIGFLAGLIAWGIIPAWKEAHTRRSDVDLIAAAISANASEQDVVVVPVWEGITFNRYYRGRAPWMTIPPINSHLVHRSDLVWKKMNEQLNQRETMAPILEAATNALRSGHRVWLAGELPSGGSKPTGSTNQWLGTYLLYWNGQLATCLQANALREETFDLSAGGPVCYLENLRLRRFSGWQTATNAPASNP